MADLHYVQTEPLLSLCMNLSYIIVVTIRNQPLWSRKVSPQDDAEMSLNVN